MAASVRPPGATVCTLLLLRDNDAVAGPRLLLGMKQRGFGKGKYNGFGGKVEPGESVLACALREMREESGLGISPSDTAHVGFLSFTFESTPGEELHAHVFTAQGGAHTGVPVATEEMAPRWFSLREPLPYADMWADDALWMPLLLEGSRFRGSFHFRGHGEIVRHALERVDPSDASPLCPYIKDVAADILLPLGAAAQQPLGEGHGAA